ncbi:MAG: hypothetical protein RIC55_08740 [Pirellulaceae bacterium]
MKRILVPTLMAVLMTPLATLVGADVEWAGGPAAVDESSAVQPVAFLQRVFGRNRGCACQAPSCAAPACTEKACEAPRCAAPACGCETSSCCKNPCDNGLLGALRCRLQAAAARRRCKTSQPSCVGCTTPTCGAMSCLAAIRVRRYTAGCGCGVPSGCCDAPTCCAEPCSNHWGSYCPKRPSLLDAMQLALARYRARRCSSCSSCTSCGCTTPGCAEASAGSLHSPFMDDEESTPPTPPVEENSHRARRLRPLAEGGQTAMGTGVASPQRSAPVNVRMRPIAPRAVISRTAHEEELVQGAVASEKTHDVFAAMAASQRPTPRQLSVEQRKADELETSSEPTSEVSALPTLIRFIK